MLLIDNTLPAMMDYLNRLNIASTQQSQVQLVLLAFAGALGLIVSV